MITSACGTGTARWIASTCALPQVPRESRARSQPHGLHHQSRGARATAERRRLGTVDVGGFGTLFGLFPSREIVRRIVRLSPRPGRHPARSRDRDRATGFSLARQSQAAGPFRPHAPSAKVSGRTLSERALPVMLGDSHYGSSDNMALTREQNINLVAPARPPKGAVSGRLTLEDFTLNEEGLVLRCPNNVEPVSASLAKAKLQARFDLSICQKCPDILRCPVQAAKRDGQFSRFQYTPARAANQKRRLYEQSDAFRDVYRWRAGIEATMSRLKYQMNLAHLRIRGMPAMRYVVNLRALGLNIRRCAAIAP